MGQNFLVEPAVARDIVKIANIQFGEVVMEIGPGLGILTCELVTAGARVLAVELDHQLKAFLDTDLSGVDSVQVIERDALHVDIETYVGNDPYTVVANLPYSSGTAIVRRFLTLEHPPVRLTVMLQREVAERMVAEPPGMSLLTLAVQVYATASIQLIVPPDVFHPPPKVESAVVRLDCRERPLVDGEERVRMFDLATLAFQRRRKTISNGLSQGLGQSKSAVDSVLQEMGIDPTRRPQTLSVGDWIAVTGAFPGGG